MAQNFFAHSATIQSTLKSTHHRVPAKLSREGRGCNLNPNSTDKSLSGISPDDGHEQQRSSPVNVMDEAVASTAGNVRIDNIGKKAQDLIERINHSRTVDQNLMNSLEEKLMKKVSEMCQLVREQMFEYYEKHSQGMETKLTELTEVLERSSQLSMELQEASQTLAVINKGLQQTSGQ